jgi:hypothetical protein
MNLERATTSRRRITNYFYTNNLLSRKEVQSQDGMKEHTMETYDYDTVGNMIDEKYYSEGANKSFSLQNEKKWEYDKNNRIIKVFESPNKGEMYLRKTYHYENNDLKEIKVYNLEGNLFYSYLYEYDVQLQKKSVYVSSGNSKRLENEYFYNNKNQLIQEVNYFKSYNSFLDHSTRTYELYVTNNLIYKEKFQSNNGANAYFKHYYFTSN